LAPEVSHLGALLVVEDTVQVLPIGSHTVQLGGAAARHFFAKFRSRDFPVTEPVAHSPSLESEGVSDVPVRTLCLFEFLDLIVGKVQAVLEPNDCVG
jgi:hypothetical protein